MLAISSGLGGGTLERKVTCNLSPVQSMHTYQHCTYVMGVLTNSKAMYELTFGELSPVIVESAYNPVVSGR